MQAECIYQDDTKDKVLHRVTNTVDGKTYQITSYVPSLPPVEAQSLISG